MRCDLCGFDDTLFPNGPEIHARVHGRAIEEIESLRDWATALYEKVIQEGLHNGK